MRSSIDISVKIAAIQELLLRQNRDTTAWIARASEQHELPELDHIAVKNRRIIGVWRAWIEGLHEAQSFSEAIIYQRWIDLASVVRDIPVEAFADYGVEFGRFCALGWALGMPIPTPDEAL